MSGTVRQQKYGRLILKELSDIFQRNQRGWLGSEFITVADVRMSPDLSFAKVYISMMLVKDKDKLLSLLDTHKKEIRKALGERIRNQSRIVPEIAFFRDEVEENAQRMDDIMQNLHVPPGPIIGQILNALFAEVEAETLMNDEETLKQRMKELYAVSLQK
jgi:ribosome-binding factor A